MAPKPLFPRLSPTTQMLERAFKSLDNENQPPPFTLWYNYESTPRYLHTVGAFRSRLPELLLIGAPCPQSGGSMLYQLQHHQRTTGRAFTPDDLFQPGEGLPRVKFRRVPLASPYTAPMLEALTTYTAELYPWATYNVLQVLPEVAPETFADENPGLYPDPARSVH